VQNITPFLWFDNQAEEATNFYVSTFKNSKMIDVARYGEAGPGTPGTVMTTVFEIEGTRFIALNGGPVEGFTFSPATSFVINCDTQEEVDRLWDTLSEGGRPNQCGWLTDRYGVTWQVVPAVLPELLSDPDREKSQRVMKAMLEMTKIDIQALKDAGDNRHPEPVDDAPGRR
jgi:predicted 3-demethylubiquinone-9 3-methyltransferase (glyoxalase superfamily)